MQVCNVHPWSKVFLGQLLQSASVDTRHLGSIGFFYALARCRRGDQFGQRSVEYVGDKTVMGLTNPHKQS